MRISSQWLAEFVDVPPSRELSHVFEMAGLGVENVEDAGSENAVWTLEVTSNRGDCLSAIGLAREIAAMTGKRLRVPQPRLEVEVETQSAGVPRPVVEIENAEDCPRYMARVIDGLQLGPSPDWMQRRLTECGMRPVNNIVDVTNYVMLETGQPLHAFDAARVPEHRIVVRRARPNETLVTLDGATRQLNPEVLLIAGRDEAIGIAGIMGGQSSEVTENTTRIILESARFSPLRVRRGARALNLSSEATRRFERSVDPNGVMRACDRAAMLLQEVAGGKTLPLDVDVYPQPVREARVTLRAGRCNALLGLRLSVETIASCLQRLQLNVAREGEETLVVSVPTFRADIGREVDLIEEVARVHGYEHIPQTLPRTVTPTAGRSLSQRLEERAKSALLRCGLSEVITLSMQNEAAVARAGLEARPAVRLQNPLSEEHTQLRTSLVPSLLEVLGKNGRSGARVFELGKVYLPREDGAQPNGTQSDGAQPDETPHIGVAMLDVAASPAHWQKEKAGAASADFFAMKGILETALQELGAPPLQWRAASQAPFHPGRCATLAVDGQDIGVAGEVHPTIAARYDLSARALLATVDFGALVRHISLLKKYQPLARFPTVERDIALVLRRDLPAASVEAVLLAAGGPLLQSARTFDVYSGAPIEEGFKSLALALRFAAPDRTLTDAEVEEVMARIREAARRELDAQLR